MQTATPIDEAPISVTKPLQPPGYTTLFPYFFVDDAAGFCRFLTEAFGAEERGRSMDGERIANAQLAIGDTTIMVSEAVAAFPAMAASYYLYVDDADAAMARAKAACASEIMPVADQPYGDRQGGVKDGWGNYWWISQRLKAGDYD